MLAKLNAASTLNTRPVGIARMRAQHVLLNAGDSPEIRCRQLYLLSTDQARVSLDPGTLIRLLHLRSVVALVSNGQGSYQHPLSSDAGIVEWRRVSRLRSGRAFHRGIPDLPLWRSNPS